MVKAPCPFLDFRGNLVYDNTQNRHTLNYGGDNMFIGREMELEDLTSRLNSTRFEMIPIYGRRRVGKTHLLEEFTKDKRAIFCTADQFGEQSNLVQLSRAINEVLAPESEGSVFATFEEAFESVANYCEKKSESLVFIIDEYPYMVQSQSGISSVLQRVIDKRYLKLSNLMLILTGSQMSFMEKQVLGYESPLYGRRTAQIKLLPLSFEESRAFLPNMNEIDFLTVYGLTGGIPLYLSMFDNEKSLADNIKNNVLKRNAFLYEEPQNLLMQELRMPNRYNDILEAIANGATEMRDITGKTHIESGNLTKYLSILIDLNIVEKQIPLTRIGKKKPIYKIKDGLFHFWYRYVPKYKNFIETGRIDTVWKRIELDLVQFTSLIFEDYCKGWILLNDEVLVSEVGSWWGNNPLIRDASSNAEEVDVIGIGLEKDELIIGECKWRNEITDMNVGEKLVERSKFFPYPHKHLFIFSKSRFSNQLVEYGKEHGIRLLTFSEMTKKKTAS